MKKLSIFWILFLMLIAADLSAKTRLSLTPGTMQAGGHVMMPIVFVKGGETLVGLSLAPQFDFFLARSFSLGVSAALQKDALTMSNLPWTFSFKLVAHYYFDVGGLIYPYVGLGAGIQWQTIIKTLQFPITTPVGMLIAVNNHVALDFGIPLEFVFNTDGFLRANLPIGYFGVRAFF